MQSHRHVLPKCTSKGNGKKINVWPTGLQSVETLLKVNSLSSKNYTRNWIFAFKNPGLCAGAPWEGFGAFGEGVGIVDTEVDNSWDLDGKDGDVADVWDEEEKASMSMFRLLPLKSMVLETLWCRLINASRWSASRLSRYSWGTARACREKVINH